MSAKGRGSEVVADENYPTPEWTCRRLFEALAGFKTFSALGDGQNWLEPCAGEGAICRAVRRTFPKVKLDGIEIRDVPKPQCVNGFWLPGVSALAWPARDQGDCWDVVDVAITNPPFSLAPELIRHLLPRCNWLILLLRSSFRLGEWRHNMPDEYKLPQRPEFVASEICKGNNAREGGCGWKQKIALSEPKTPNCPVCSGRVQRSTSDNSEYSWFVWTPDRDRSVGNTRVLPETSLSERREVSGPAVVAP